MSLNAKVVILPDGSFALMVQEGTFEQGKEVIEQTLAKLRAQGINISQVSPVEQHRHADNPNVTVEDRTQVKYK